MTSSGVGASVARLRSEAHFSARSSDDGSSMWARRIAWTQSSNSGIVKSELETYFICEFEPPVAGQKPKKGEGKKKKTWG